MVLGVASVLVYVSDMDRAVDFYRSLLDAPLTHRDPTTATLRVGGDRLILHRDKHLSRAGTRGAMGFNLEVDDARQFYETVRARDVEVNAPQRMPWGWTLVTVCDPDGNLIELYETEKASFRSN